MNKPPYSSSENRLIARAYATPSAPPLDDSYVGRSAERRAVADLENFLTDCVVTPVAFCDTARAYMRFVNSEERTREGFVPLVVGENDPNVLVWYNVAYNKTTRLLSLSQKSKEETEAIITKYSNARNRMTAIDVTRHHAFDGEPLCAYVDDRITFRIATHSGYVWWRRRIVEGTGAPPEYSEI